MTLIEVNWEKRYLTLRQRLVALKDSFDWLTMRDIDSYDYETKKWTIEKIHSRDRLECFLSGIQTFLIGYVWRYRK